MNGRARLCLWRHGAGRFLTAMVGLVMLFSMATSPSFAQGTSNGIEPVDTTSMEIAQTTASGLGTCFKWQPTGVCFWLVCSIYECHVDETIRFQHNQPDVVVSTYHDASTHPWRDYGRPIAKQAVQFSRTMLRAVTGSAIGSLLSPDTGGTKTKHDRDTRNYIFRGADAIGNPFTLVSSNFSGGSPSSVTIPQTTELQAWFQQFPSQVGYQWASIGSSYTPSQTSFAQSQTNQNYTGLGLGSGGGQASGLANSYNQTMASNGNTLSNPDGDGSSVNSENGGAGSSDSYLCPAGLGAFGLAFQSDLDSYFWRNFIPLELIYPASWLPGMREVGSGILQTWGAVWPRTGSLFQQDPVKGSAVIAQRAGDIISYKAQPHIYTALKTDSTRNVRFFGFQGIKENDEYQTVWQRAFPNPQSECSAFGKNDAVSLSSFGDGQNVNSRGTVWIAWRRAECCYAARGAAAFLFAVP